jgi:hypothetical protein
LGLQGRLVAELYPDTFQIVVRRDSGIAGDSAPEAGHGRLQS